MKALVYAGPGRLVLRDVPAPVAAPGEVIVTVARAGICGSDMLAFLGHDGRRLAPLILGHEVAGTIAGGPRAGTRVVVDPLIVCGACAPCRAGRTNLCLHRQLLSLAPREGGFAPWVAVPEGNLTPVPDDVALAQAALAEPLACGWNAARQAIARNGGPGRALVLGGGAIGLGAALCLAAQGSDDVTLVEPLASRRAWLADRCGIDAVAAAETAEGIDMVIDAVGMAATRKVASAVVRPGGTIVHIGLGDAVAGLDMRRITLEEIAVLGSFAHTQADFRDAFAALASGRLGRLDWVEDRPLSEGGGAFDDIRDGRVAAPKIHLIPDP